LIDFTEGRRKSDGVLVDLGRELVGTDRVAPTGNRDLARLDVEVAAELVPDDVHVGAVHEVRPVVRLAGLRARGLPAPLHRQRAEHHRLGGPGACGTRGVGLAVAMEEVVDHAHAALRDLGGARVLGVVDVVAMEVMGDHRGRLRVHECRHERREVLHRVAVEQHLRLEQCEGGPRLAAVLGHLAIDRRLREVALGYVQVLAGVDVFRAFAQHHATVAQAHQSRRGGVHASGDACLYDDYVKAR
jgi:hypothetical protein